MPILSSTAASSTEPAVGAIVCAGGSQVCTGHSGTLTAQAGEEQRGDEHLAVAGSPAPRPAAERRRSAVPAEATRARMPTSIRVEPSTV